MPEVESFVCPFCGAPYRMLIPAGAVQVVCQYCKSTIFVPPRLGGVVKRCPNHPDVMAVGLCNDCDKSFCARCLYIQKLERGKLHICSECYQNRRKRQAGGLIVLAFVSIAIGLVASTQGPYLLRVVTLAFFGILFLSSLLAALYQVAKKPLAVSASAKAHRAQD